MLCCLSCDSCIEMPLDMRDVSQAVGSFYYYNILETCLLPASIKCSAKNATGCIILGSSADVNMNHLTGGPGPFPLFPVVKLP